MDPNHLAAAAPLLARLGAHPGRAWLAAYLDVLDERYEEMSQDNVSEAVRGVAALDRLLLAAWRQAAPERRRMRALAAAQQQREAQMQQQERAEVQQQQQQQAHEVRHVRLQVCGHAAKFLVIN